MDTQFWHQRWKNREIGFHNAEPNRYLSLYWDDLNIPVNSTIFVPLCGKSLDMVWLVSKGYKVIGVELSEMAVREFFEEAEIEPEILEMDGFLLFHSPGIQIYCGDFFSLKNLHLKDVDGVFDRGSLVALPTKMREAYMSHLSGILPSAIHGLLVAMEYDQASMAGPPFSVLSAEVKSLFEEFDNIEELGSEEIEFRDRTVRMRIWTYNRGYFFKPKARTKSLEKKSQLRNIIHTLW